MAARVASLAWMLATSQIHASVSARIGDVVQSGRESQDCGRRCPAVLCRDVVSVLWPGLLRQDGVCLARVHDLHKHVHRATVHAEGDLRVTLQLSLFDTAAAPPDLTHRQEDAKRLVDVHDAVCADAKGAHEPAQLDEQPMRVGVLLLRAAELSHALGGLLAAQEHATQESPHPTAAGTSVECLDVLSCCRWARLQRVQRLKQHSEC